MKKTKQNQTKKTPLTFINQTYNQRTRKLFKKLWDFPCHNKRKSIQAGNLQLRNLCVLLGISMLVIFDNVI